jgi:hypothetical protein
MKARSTNRPQSVPSRFSRRASESQLFACRRPGEATVLTVLAWLLVGAGMQPGDAPDASRVQHGYLRVRDGAEL